VKCLATTLVFNIRELANKIPYTAILYVNYVATPFTAVIPDGSTSFSIVANSNTPLQLEATDLISIYLSYTGGGALSDGMCATLLATPN
jgi:hypothetical protein